MKFAGAGAGPRGLMTEFLGLGIARLAGLSVPAARALHLPEKFPWQIGTDEFDELVQRSVGWNLGVAAVADARPVAANDLDRLPDEFRQRLACVDRLLQNFDRTRANPNLLESPAGVFAIDFGSCLFVNRIVGGSLPFDFSLPPNHFLTGTEYQADCDGAALTAAETAMHGLIAEPPDDWLAGLPFGRKELEWRLAAYIKEFARLS